MKKITQELFLNKCAKIHGNKYDYSNSNYSNSRSIIEIICKIHGKFYMKANNHLNGQGCPECSGKKKMNKYAFIKKAQTIHNNKFDYSNVIYKNNKTKIIIKCASHGEFLQTPNDHLSGKGCFECTGIKRLTIDEFILKANLVHHNKYDYSLVNYINSKVPINIVCKIHGSFWQTPTSHLSGNNCNKCSYNCISKMESRWLDSLNIPIEYRQKSIIIDNIKYRVDAFDPTTNTIYEFYGDYWHGNINKYDPDQINLRSKRSFRELYEKTINRELIFKNNCFNLISIWESDFKKDARK